jgi:hypothetical protein
LAFSVARRIGCIVREELYSVLVGRAICCIKVEVNGSGGAILGDGIEDGVVDVVVGAGVGIGGVVGGGA